MELLKAKEKCCGCAACAHVCPVNAIQMESDDEGFLYPKIDHSLCIDCGACKATCEFQKETPPSEGALKYAAFRAPTEVRKKSQSGALFYEAARAFLNNGGVVYGAVLEKNFSVGFARAASLEQLEPMRGSKYVQAEISQEIYTRIKQDLNNGLNVMFCGTTCQAAQIYNMFGQKYPDQLIVLDIVCHGVPSPLLWKEYLNYQSGRLHHPITSADFRDKRFGWHSHIEHIKAGKKSYTGDIWTQLFYSHLALRPSCFHCWYRGLKHYSDITIADCWGIENERPDWDDTYGVSLCIVQSNRGLDFMKDNQLQTADIEIQNCLQTPLKKCYPVPSERAVFWKLHREKGFAAIARQYGGDTIRGRLRTRLKCVAKRGKAMIERKRQAKC